ncbi:flagellin N-terminal helical domain-containing protein [Zavarzinella formosa]|uniref:flagellin N-terminal helical domain-containing protein n=1 Tax=Zavarzinella formosa TaxID=360055 RepID=UPI000315B19A|nr:flagellin [Zavarzinella formosa]
MGLSLVNNTASLTAQNNLNKTAASLNTSLERLSTGLKINKGADGPAALVISEQQRAQITGLQAATDNTNKAVAVVQTGEGALNEMNSLLNKVRSLAVDSANTGVNDANAQAANQAEITNILSSVDRISSTTQFGSKKLLDGSAGVSGTATVPSTVTVQKATTDTQAGSYAIAVTAAATKAHTSAAAQTLPLAADENLTVNGVQIQLKAGSSQQQVVDKINSYKDQTGVSADIDTVNGNKTRLISNQFGTAAKISVVSDTAVAAGSTGFGTSVTSAAGTDVVGTINGTAATGVGNTLTATSGVAQGLSVSVGLDATLSATGADKYTSASTASASLGNVNVVDNSLKFQIGANAGQSVSFSFDKVDTSSLGTGASSLYSNLSQISTANGTESLKVIDQAISDVSNLRGRIGAFQSNTLESNANNLQTSLQNTTASESVVRDTDFASEIANFTKAQTQLQAGTTVLGNANQLTSLVASLLRG